MTARTPLALVLALALALAPSCKETVIVPGDESTIQVDLRATTTPDALGDTVDVGSLTVHFIGDDDEVYEFFIGVQGEQVGGEPGPPDPSELGTHDAARLFVWGMTVQNPPRAYSLGRSAPFAVPASGTVNVPVFFAPIDRFADPDEAALAAAGASVVTLTDGRVLVFGGLPANGAALFDPSDGSASDVPAADPVFSAGCALDDGRAVFAGGSIGGVPQRHVWVFDDNTVTQHDDVLLEAFVGASLACLDDGRAVLLGGLVGGTPAALVFDVEVTADAVNVSDSGELLSAPRAFASLTRLDLSGGAAFLHAGGRTTGDLPTASADFLEATSGGFTLSAAAAAGNASADLGVARWGHTAVALPNLSVLVWGGADENGPLADPSPVLFSPELSSPGGFLPVTVDQGATLTGERVGAASVSLPDGTVLLAGGTDGTGAALFLEPKPDQVVSAIDEYVVDVRAGESASQRNGGSAVWLDDGSVLLTGGHDDFGSVGTTSTAIAAERVVLCEYDNRCSP